MPFNLRPIRRRHQADHPRDREMSRSTSTLKSARVSSGIARTERDSASIKAVPLLDLDRFMGRWNEIARLPSPAQRETDQQIALIFSHRDEHLVLVKQVCVQADGSPRELTSVVRRRYPIEEPGQFQRRHGPSWLGWLPSMWEEIWVLAIDRDYRWVLMGDPQRRNLWILSRDMTMERSVLETLKSKARAMGYDLAPLIVSGELRSYQPM